MKTQQGFTLIEMVVVITMMAILSASAIPRFLGMEEAAKAIVVETVATNFQASVQLSRIKYHTTGLRGGAQDLRLWGNNENTLGLIDINPNGYPSKHSLGGSGSLHTQNKADCQSLWEALLETNLVIGDNPDSADYLAEFQSPALCLYKLHEDPALFFTYNTHHGKVVFTDNRKNNG